MVCAMKRVANKIDIRRMHLDSFSGARFTQIEALLQYTSDCRGRSLVEKLSA
jgi:hypothetical protein